MTIHKLDWETQDVKIIGDVVIIVCAVVSSMALALIAATRKKLQ